MLVRAHTHLLCLPTTLTLCKSLLKHMKQQEDFCLDVNQLFKKKSHNSDLGHERTNTTEVTLKYVVWLTHRKKGERLFLFI